VTAGVMGGAMGGVMQGETHTQRPQPARALPLDALRGIAILAMVLSGQIPFGVLPEWMYHAQVPPPKHIFNGALPGITWVDLVFPFFLFAMGAAIPLALQARINAGDKLRNICASIFWRGLLLAFFAIYVKHIQPQTMSAAPNWHHYVLCLIGFALLFPLFMRLPSHFNLRWRVFIRAFGWLGAAAVLFLFSAKDGSSFKVERSDIIILVLANVFVGAALVWLVTRDRLDWRFGILAFLFALRLTESLPGLGQMLWNASPAKWLGTVYFQQYLFIVVPGTIAGDCWLRYINSRLINAAYDQSRGILNAAQMLTVAITVALVFATLIGLKSRVVVETTLACAALCALAWWLNKNASPLLRQLIGYGIFFLLLGLAFEPYEGGIRKDRGTMSYYFVTAGLAFFSLSALHIILDIAKRSFGFKLLIASGQNPLVAYAGVNSLLVPLLALTGLGSVIATFTATPWMGVLRAFCYTLLLAAFAAFCTNRKFILRT
jgi:predicted acyltransferase